MQKIDVKSALIIAVLSSAFGLSLLAPFNAAAASTCSDLFQSKALVPSTKGSGLQAGYSERIQNVVRLFEATPQTVLRSRPTHDQVLLMTELASISNRTQADIAAVIDSVPRITFRSTTSYSLRIRIATLSVLSGKSVDETLAMMASVPYKIRNFVIRAETAEPILDLAATSGREPVEIVRVIDSIPDITFKHTTSWSFRMWLAKIQILGNHKDFRETESLIRSVPKFIFNHRISPETLASIVELSVISGRSPAEIVNVLESTPRASWNYANSFETRMWLTKLSILSGQTPAQIETASHSVPASIMQHTTSIAQKRFVMSLSAVGQNKKAYELIDRPIVFEQPIGFWEVLSRYLFE